MQDPIVASIHSACDCLKTIVGAAVIGVGAGVVCVGGLALMVVASPVAMAVSGVVLPILGVPHWMNHRNHQFLYNKTMEISGKEIHGKPWRHKTGPTLEKNYMKNIPKKLETRQGPDWDHQSSPFNTVRDLSWLWVEHHRLEAEDKMKYTSDRIKSWACLLMPVIGIYWCFTRDASRASQFDRDEEAISPKQAVERHFYSLRERFMKYHRQESPNSAYYCDIVNTLLNRTLHLHEDANIPKDLPVDQFYQV